MTTSPVTSITDELLVEIEQYASNVSVDGARSAAVSAGELRGLLARLRQAEKDAERYRWLREQVLLTNGMSTEFRFDGDKFSTLDEAIDSAMQATRHD